MGWTKEGTPLYGDLDIIQESRRHDTRIGSSKPKDKERMVALPRIIVGEPGLFSADSKIRNILSSKEKEYRLRHRINHNAHVE